ncbi:M28 family peptidase [Sphingomonas sp. TDK1]|uniref:M28 family peptidase n=1 Tax=Sphingomonas sp. TDK1 TaxID=453247 RepID=UPI0007DA02FE|nr:M28 family peptidase [Sphingomonas sp. TDK1]OAN65423.1 peptidase M28 [Sphingomonas sp. TDK1]
MTLRPLLALFLLASPVLAQQAPLTPEQAALKAHVQFLASDALRGREAGTRDFDVAAEYVAARMLAMGLKPGANGGWFQQVKLVTYRPAEKAAWTLMRGGKSVALAFGKDFVNEPVASRPDFRAEGEVVFAGYGIVYPDGQRDDYKGLDVRGKIVAILAGAPKGLPSDVTAHFGDDGQKARLAAARGAKAVLVIETMARRREMTVEGFAPYFAYPRTGWAGPDGVANDVSPDAPMVGQVSQAGAAKLFEGARIRWADVLAAETRGRRIPTGPLVGTLGVATKTRLSTRESRNVVGMIEGSDPALKSQAVVLSAHLDHVGVGEPVKGDTIYNGAMDNAIGVSMLLEIAKAIEQGKRPRRTLLFVALTAEEKGLIGSDYFAHFPTVPKGTIVADVNFDMPILTYPLVDLVVLGGERSSIGTVVTAAARAEGLGVVPDPAPEEMFFVRSDHYSFVQAGIPSVSIDTGPGGTGAAVARKFLDENYHKPSDQIDLPFDWNSAVKYKHVGLATVQALANGDAQPSWNKGDFFGILFSGTGAR